jgi:RimJ/RimL family protein N-acetyltransferase
MALDDMSAAWGSVPTLSGTHVRLEPLQPAHATGLREAAADGALWNLRFTSVPAPHEADAYVDRALAQRAAGNALPFLVRDASGSIVGTTRLYDLDPATPRATIGYTWYARRAQRTGLNTEAKLLLLTHAFETLRCVAVAFETSTENLASRAAIARLGASQDGIVRNHERHKDGSLRDTVLFSILDREWPDVRRGLRARLEVHA